jgi:hypothetical protein
MKLNLVIAAALLLAGCSLRLIDPPESQERLSLACETARCDCRSPKSSFSFAAQTVEPVQWRGDGSASCREGLLLGRVQ